MDQIEFRPMNTGIQTTGNAQIVDPAAALNAPQNGAAAETGENGHVYYRNCEEAKVHTLDAQEIANTGRVLDVNLTLRSVCPCRHVSVGCLITELDEEDNEYSRGFKALTVQPHYNSSCRDVEVETVRFILPDDARVDNRTGQCCGTRHFRVRAEAHYADTNVSMT